MKKTALWIVLVFLSFSGCAGRAEIRKGATADSVRVLILESAAALEIDGVKGEGGAKIALAADGVVEANGKEAALPLRFAPKKDFLYLDGKPYRGILEVRRKEDGLMVVNTLSIEHYVWGVINHEISTRWNVEAVKAQAIAIRTYAVYQKRNRAAALYDVVSTFMDQSYGGAEKEDGEIVKETAGKILFYDGDPAFSVYHSNAGGRTEDSTDVWSGSYPYLKSVESPYDSTGPNYSWELSITADFLKERLSRIGRDCAPEAIRINEKTSTGRAKVVDIECGGDTIAIKGEDLRKAVGYAILRSTLFEVENTPEGFLFKGMGAGHGVGMSQWGAKGMAEDGYSYKKILKHYYPGTVIKRIY